TATSGQPGTSTGPCARVSGVTASSPPTSPDGPVTALLSPAWGGPGREQEPGPRLCPRDVSANARVIMGPCLLHRAARCARPDRSDALRRRHDGRGGRPCGGLRRGRPFHRLPLLVAADPGLPSLRQRCGGGGDRTDEPG